MIPFLTQKNSILLIVFIGFLVFFNILFNKFVLDDPSQITFNPAIQSLSNIPNLFLGSTFGGGRGSEGLFYKPVMTTFYTLIYSFFGASEFFFHLVQLIFHISNAILVLILFKKFFKPELSLILAVIFLVHPMSAEAVQYISDLQDVLFFFFGMLALLFITTEKLHFKNYLLFTIFISLSFLSKESGILFLVVSLIYRRIFSFKTSIKFYLLSAAILGVYLTLRYLAVGIPISSEHIFPIERISLLERLTNIPAIVFYYLKTYFWPQYLSVGQQWIISLNLKEFYIPVISCFIFLFSVIILGFKIYQTSTVSFKTYLFFCFWFFVGLGLHLHIIPLDATVADRWIYFPAVGLLGIIGSALMQMNKYQKLALVILVTSIIVLSILTLIRNTNWQDGLTLARHDVSVQKSSFVMENNFAFELIQAKEYDEALIHAQKSVELAPYWWLNWNNLGVIYRHQGFVNESKEAFQTAANNTNTFYLPYENLAELLINFYSPQETKEFIEQTGKHLRLNDKLLFSLSLAYYKLDQIDLAKQTALKSYSLNPNNTLSLSLYQALENNQKIQIQVPEY